MLVMGRLCTATEICRLGSHCLVRSPITSMPPQFSVNRGGIQPISPRRSSRLSYAPALPIIRLQIPWSSASPRHLCTCQSQLGTPRCLSGAVFDGSDLDLYILFPVFISRSSSFAYHYYCDHRCGASQRRTVGCWNMRNTVRVRAGGTDAGAGLRVGAGFGTGTCAGVGA
jgi:hypothetical protein